MIVYLGVTALTIALSLLVRKNQCVSYGPVECKQQVRNQYALFTIFLVLFLVAALRYYVGNDYLAYLNIFENIYVERTVSTEIGFNSVVRFYQLLFGQSTFIPIFATISGITIYFMLKALYEQLDWFFYGFLLFMLTGFYLMSLNTIRYYAALGIVMYSIKYLQKKDYLPFCLYVGLAASLHKTAIVVIPAYWFLNRKWGKIEYAIIGMGTLSLIVLEDFYRSIIFKFYPFYEGSIYDVDTVSVFNIAKCVCILAFALFFYKRVKEDALLSFYFKLNLSGLVIYVCCTYIPVVSRVAYYFIWPQIFLVTNLVAKMKKGWFKTICIVGITLAYVLFFVLFLQEASGTALRILPYQTWIGVDL
ncbi:MAG: EpsG family protein [Eubacteriales bacterium]